MKHIPAKIILFGEYSILSGSQALALPLPVFSGQLQRTAGNDPVQEDSQSKLNELFEWISKQEDILDFLKLDEMGSDLQRGMYFRSNIPEGAGLGSSGALIAAIYARYGQDPADSINLAELRKRLSLLESYFHLRSSGIDPLVSILQKAILVAPEFLHEYDSIHIRKKLKSAGMFLLNSGLQRETSKLVSLYNQQMQNNAVFREKLLHDYIPLNDRCISDLLDKKLALDLKLLFELASLQEVLLKDMFPEKMLKHLRQGIVSGIFALKLCGAGGGGYFLGFTKKRQESEKYFKSEGLSIEWL